MATDQTTRLEAATVKAENGSQIIYDVANGDASVMVQTASGPVPTVAGKMEEISKTLAISSGIYPTTAAALAATSNGQIFLVYASDDDDIIYRVYRNDNGTAFDTGKKTISGADLESALAQAGQAAITAQQAADTATQAAASITVDLSNSADSAKGSGLIGFKPSYSGAVGRKLSEKVKETVSVSDFGSLGDFNGTSGTDNSTAFAAALDVSNSIYIPLGTHYVTSSSVHRRLEKANFSGPGKVAIPYFGNTVLAGSQVRAGICATEIGSDLPGGFVIGGDDPAQPEGMRMWAQHPSWMIVEPSADGLLTQVQLYSRANMGTATGAVGSDVLTAVYGDFYLTPTWSNGVQLLAVGDEIGWGGTIYQVAEVTSATQIRIKTQAGGAVSITDGSEKTFRHAYEYSFGTCDVNGTAVTWKSGIKFNTGTSVSGQVFLYLNGTRYAVSSVNSSTSITLASSAGTLTGAAFIEKDLDPARYVSLVRIQSLIGAKEENAALMIDTRGRALLDLSTAGGLKAPGFTVRSDASWDGTGNEEHFNMNNAGQFGLGQDPENGVQVSRRVVNATASNGPTNGGGNARAIFDRWRSTFGGANPRVVEQGIANNFLGWYNQSYQADGVSPTQGHLNPVGGSIAIGTWADVNSLGMRLGVAGVIAPTGDNQFSLGLAGYRFSTVFAGTGTINTSDERLKQDVQPIEDRALRAWARVNFVQYRFRDAVEQKADGARWHFGVIAQRVKEAFEAEGLDPFAYGILCYDSWDADEDGQREAGDRYGIRYEEALVLECAYLRSKIKD